MQHLSVLLIEDDPGDAGLIKYTLRYDQTSNQLIWIESMEALEHHLVVNDVLPDVVLLDLNLPDSTGIETVHACKKLISGTPIVVLTGHDDTEFALQALEAGAQDYLIKGSLDADSLSRAMRYAISRAKLEQRLVLSEERMAAAIEGGKLGVWDWLFDRNEFEFSDRWLAAVGFDKTSVGLPANADAWLARIHPEDRSHFDLAVERHVSGELPNYQCEFRIRHREGHWVWIFESGHITERDGAGNPVRMVGVQQDISERKALEERLTHLAMRDELTGLYNRRRFMECSDQEYGRLKRQTAYEVGTLMLDLDRFKLVNDTYGHAAGDQMLKGFADTVQRQLRENDLFGRLGGEEFAILLPHTDLQGCERVAEKVRAAVEAMRIPLESGETLTITTSVGLTMMHKEDTRPDGALARADKALYQAKHSGRNRVVVQLTESVQEPTLP